MPTFNSESALHMNNKIKISIITLLVLLVVGTVGIWYALGSIDQSKLTQLLSSSVKEATGRDLKITGPVKLTFFPSVGVVAQDLSLSNASWATNPEMLIVKQLDLDIKLLPLFAKRVEINQINLSGLDAHLQSNTAGVGNWVFTAPVAPVAPGASGPVSVPTQASEDSGNTLVAIDTLNVSDARVSYQDSSGQQKIYQIANLSLRGEDGNTHIKLSAKQGDMRLGVDGKITAIRKILSDWDQDPLKIDMNIKLDLNGKTLTVKGDIQKQPKSIPSFELLFSSQSFDLAPLAGASAIAASGGKLPVAPSRSKTSSPYFFSNTPIPFDLLPRASGRINVNISQLGLPNYAPIKNVLALILFKDEQIDLQNLSYQLGDGSAKIQATISKFQSASPTVSIKGEAKAFTLEQVLKAADGTSKVSGGDTRIAFDLRGSGASLHQIMGGLNGKAQISVVKASLPSSYINQGGDFIVSLFDAINPLRKKSNQTVLECAAAYLPVNNGLVSIANSVGAQTDRLDVVLSGSVNLNTEVINLNIYPREKSGLTTGLDLADLIKLQGTLKNPSTGINKAGVVNSAVSIGLGFLTGGATILAENAKSLATKSQPCNAALRPWSEVYAETK